MLGKLSDVRCHTAPKPPGPPVPGDAQHHPALPPPPCSHCHGMQWEPSPPVPHPGHQPAAGVPVRPQHPPCTPVSPASSLCPSAPHQLWLPSLHETCCPRDGDRGTAQSRAPPWHLAPSYPPGHRDTAKASPLPCSEHFLPAQAAICYFQGGKFGMLRRCWCSKQGWVPPRGLRGGKPPRGEGVGAGAVSSKHGQPQALAAPLAPSPEPPCPLAGGAGSQPRAAAADGNLLRNGKLITVFTLLLSKA